VTKRPKLGSSKKGPPCTICRHPDRVRIEAVRCAGASLDLIAQKFGCSRDALHRHMHRHLPEDLRMQYALDVPIRELAQRAANEGVALIALDPGPPAQSSLLFPGGTKYLYPRPCRRTQRPSDAGVRLQPGRTVRRDRSSQAGSAAPPALRLCALEALPRRARLPCRDRWPLVFHPLPPDP
jgi:hypothetical protein